MMNRSELQSLLKNLCREIESLWAINDYKSDPSSSRKNYVITSVESNAPVLPKSKFPIRGTPGVEVNSRESHDQRALTDELITDSLLEPPQWRSQYQNTDEVEVRRRIGIYTQELFSEFDEIPNLLERLTESFGFKHFEPDELTERIRRKDDNYLKIEKALFLSRILANKLNLKGFDPKKKAPFENWDEIALQATERIYSIVGKAQNEYEIVICLNAPVIDEKDPLALAEVVFQNSILILSIEYATDDLLSRLHTTDVQLQRINTAIKFQITLDVNAPVESYLDTYWLGAQIAERVVDCFRLVRDDDIGVIALEVLPIDDFTPSIRKTYEVSYQSELALFVPKRFSFETEATTPLSQEEQDHIRKLLSFYPEIHTTEGLDVAIRRFRSSCERYHPSDPERLLDMAFSFEAMFLNDGENKELSYRLSLRAARFLGDSLDGRQGIFDVVKNLYAFRSRIAHGETLDSMKPGDAAKLKKVLARAPKMLKNALIQMILGNGPKGLGDNESRGNWWRKLELS